MSKPESTTVDLSTIIELQNEVHKLYLEANVARDLAREAEKELDRLIFDIYNQLSTANEGAK